MSCLPAPRAQPDCLSSRCPQIRTAVLKPGQTLEIGGAAFVLGDAAGGASAAPAKAQRTGTQVRARTVGWPAPGTLHAQRC